ncbi:MAG: hypothetical protein ACOZAO_00420 [Patescibacteria group bacterium]
MYNVNDQTHCFMKTNRWEFVENVPDDNVHTARRKLETAETEGGSTAAAYNEAGELMPGYTAIWKRARKR